jgi:4-alpha-glucanotransferase
MTAKSSTRRAGVLVPLFSCVSSGSWGIGDIGDLEPMVDWLASAGLRVLQLLPANEMAPDTHSPYSAISAMAIDPVFIRLSAVEDYVSIGGERSLSEADRAVLGVVRVAPAIRHREVRTLKMAALRAAFDRFLDAEWRRGTPRAGELRSFAMEQAWWVEDYALFRALHAREQERPWTTWPEPLKHRNPRALDAARVELADELLFLQYLQWLAHVQWRAARASARARGVELFGDVPFMVDGDSVDVWVHQDEFDLDASVGTPPDAFSASGQNWGVPVYRWDRIAVGGFKWLRDRARRAAGLYDGCRVDHLVGFYRTYGRPKDGSPPAFTPALKADQLKLGETILGVFSESGLEIIAEDLGTVPPFVRASLARLGVPGYRVLRWEREWELEGQPFRDPAAYPARSVATSGTHDTETLDCWWNETTPAERIQISALPTVKSVTASSPGPDLVGAAYDPTVRDTLLEALFASGSDLLLLPIQDVFGWSDRINTPDRIDEVNWTFRLPWPCDRWSDEPQALERRARLREWAVKHRRL